MFTNTKFWSKKKKNRAYRSGYHTRFLDIDPPAYFSKDGRQFDSKQELNFFQRTGKIWFRRF